MRQATAQMYYPLVASRGGAASRPRLLDGLCGQGEEQLSGIDDPVTIANQTGGSSVLPTGGR